MDALPLALRLYVAHVLWVNMFFHSRGITDSGKTLKFKCVVCGCCGSKNYRLFRLFCVHLLLFIIAFYRAKNFVGLCKN